MDLVSLSEIVGLINMCWELDFVFLSEIVGLIKIELKVGLSVSE